MIINCTICSEDFNASSEIYSTICGHLFHYSCVLRWLERSRTCPQCRNVTTRNDLYRIYLNVRNGNESESGPVQNSSGVQNEVQHLRATIERKEREVRLAEQKCRSYENENAAMRIGYQEAKETLESTQAYSESLREQVQQLTQQVRSGGAAAVRDPRDHLDLGTEDSVTSWRINVQEKVDLVKQATSAMRENMDFLYRENRSNISEVLRLESNWQMMLMEIESLEDAIRNPEPWERDRFRSSSSRSGESSRNSRERTNNGMVHVVMDPAIADLAVLHSSLLEMQSRNSGRSSAGRSQAAGSSRRETISGPFALPRPRRTRTRVRTLFDDFNDFSDLL